MGSQPAPPASSYAAAGQQRAQKPPEQPSYAAVPSRAKAISSQPASSPTDYKELTKDALHGLGYGLGAAAKVAQKAAPIVGKALMGLSAAGQTMEEATADGATPGKAILFGAGSGVLETAIEGIAGGIPGLPKGAISGIISKITKSPIANKLLDTVGEGGEEALSTYLSPFLKRMVYDSTAPLATWNDLADSAIMGMLGAGVFTGVNSIGAPKSKLRTIPGTDITYTLDERSGEPEIKFSKPIEEMTPEEFERVLEMAESGGLTANTDTHTPEMQKIIADYQAAVDVGILNYIEDVKHNSIDKKIPYSLKNVTDEKAKIIKELTGIDVTGYKTELRPLTIEHIEKYHGKTGIRDHSMAEPQDIARIQYVIDHADNIYKGPRNAKAYTDKNGKTVPSIIYEKRINGTYFVIEAIIDSKAKTNIVHSAFKLEAGKEPFGKIGQQKKEQQPSDVQASEITPEALTTVSFIPTIAQSLQGVNSQTIPGTNITYTLDEQSGEPEIRFSKPTDEMTPEEFERVLEMAESGGLTPDTDIKGIDDAGATEYTDIINRVDAMPTDDFERALRTIELVRAEAEKNRPTQAFWEEPPIWTEKESSSYVLPSVPVVDGKVGGKISIEPYNRLRQLSIWNPQVRAIMLGRYSTGDDSYIKRAGGTSAYFDMGYEVWEQIKEVYGLSRTEMFELFNKPFLQSAIDNELRIQFSHDPRMYEGSFLESEWAYIKEKLFLTDADLQYDGGIWNVG